MDILYVVGDGSSHGDIELRYSLRSIAKHGRNVGRVIVAGHCPEWLRDVVAVPIPDRYSHKHQNIMSAIVETVEALDMHGGFLYSSDDHFYVRDVDFDDYPYYVKHWDDRELAERVRRERIDNPWHRSVMQTHEFLREHGYGSISFHQHCNTHMDADVIRSNDRLIRKAIRSRLGPEPTDLVMNLWLSGNPDACIIKRKDVKLDKADFSEVDECFSVSDAIFDDPRFLPQMDMWFPSKCRYEM